MKNLWLIQCVFIVVTTLGCKDRFEPRLSSAESNILVVEGYINPIGFTSITLSRTLPLADLRKIKPELNALVTIKGEDNSQYTLRAGANGTYKSDSVILKTNQKYRVHIKTTNGGEYLSEYVTVKLSPTIDSINWRIKDNGVHIYANTHDPQNDTRYYKWDYEETWEYRSMRRNVYKYVGSPAPTVILRDVSELDKLYYCWKTIPSSNILIGSSAQLTTDVISLMPVMFIPLSSEKTGVRYSILVKQYSLDRKAYEFYSMMKSNTESIGSIFDRLPSEITGNITCVSNPLEKVIGYIFASQVDQKRIFISRSEVPSTYVFDCETIFAPNKPDSLKYFFEDTMRYAPYQIDPGPPPGYLGTLSGCLDCRSRGGTNIKPSFW